MGHMTNSLSIRLGWTQAWVDSWFVKDYYYSDFFYMYLKIRLYLIYHFNGLRWHKVNYLYSHFEFVYYNCVNYIKIFFYDSLTENSYDEFMLEYSEVLSNFKRETRFNNISITDQYLNLWLFAILFSGADNCDMECWNNNIFAYYLARSFALSNQDIRGLMKELELLGGRGSLSRFFFFMGINRLSLRNIDIRWQWQKFRMIFYQLYSLNIKGYLASLSYYLQHMFYLLTNKTNYLIQFFLISNDSVNATFLSRFIAKKLRQKFMLREVLNPLKREWRRVMRESALRGRLALAKANKKLYQFIDYAKIIKNFWQKFYILFTLMSASFLLAYKKKYFLFFYCDLFITYKNFANLANKKKYFKYNSFLFLLRLKYYNILIKNGFSQAQFYEIKYSNVFFLLNHMFLISKFVFIDNGNYYTRNRLNIMLIASKLNKFLTYTYWAYNYNILYNDKSHLKERIKSKDPTRNFFYKGFKVRCSGRFSRRQRARGVWFSLGRVPANSLAYFVDYSYYTVPLINSAITIKVWIYKNSNTYSMMQLW